MRSTVSAFLRVQTSQLAEPVEIRLGQRAGCFYQRAYLAELYFLLRIGKAKEALECASENENRIRSTDPSFLAYLKAWVDSADRRLPRLLKDRFTAEYNSRFRTLPEVHDPYKLGPVQADRQDRRLQEVPTLLTSSIQNWLWLQLSMVRETYDEGRRCSRLGARSLHFG